MRYFLFFAFLASALTAHAQQARPLLRVRSAASSNTALSYTPAQLRHAYGFDALPQQGAGQTIAIIDAFDDSFSIQNDLNVFCTQYGLPSVTLTIHKMAPAIAYDAGWDLETHLDVEYAHAMAPSANILLVLARSNSFADLFSAVDYAVSHGANVVSMSFGAAEFSSQAAYDSHFSSASGVTFIASAGDSGTGVQYPAASPYVIGVGGTSLTLDANNNISSETAWMYGGGGVSAYYPRPAFQTFWQTNAGRSVPDVAYVADPNTGVSVYAPMACGGSGGGYCTVGGTSAGAPQWAALIADINSSRTGALTSLLSRLYALETPPSGFVNFNDIVSGADGPNAIDYAHVGFDFVTGFGSPKAVALAQSFRVDANVNNVAWADGQGNVVTARQNGLNLTYQYSGASSGTYSGYVASATRLFFNGAGGGTINADGSVFFDDGIRFTPISELPNLNNTQYGDGQGSFVTIQQSGDLLTFVYSGASSGTYSGYVVSATRLYFNGAGGGTINADGSIFFDDGVHFTRY